MSEKLRKLCKESLRFLGLTEDSLKPNQATGIILGLPYDLTSSFRPGGRFGPDAIRQASSAEMMNSFTEHGIDLTQKHALYDFGDLDITLSPPKIALDKINTAAELIWKEYEFACFLGGDHSITPPLVEQTSKKHTNLGLVYFDAHLDFYEEYKGSRLSHACTMHRIIETGSIPPENILIIGCRSLPDDHLKQTTDLGMGLITTEDIDRLPQEKILSKVKKHLPNKVENMYVSLDLDVFDPAFAPGVGNPEPGGMTPGEVIRILQDIKKPLGAFDIVELTPPYDKSDLTAILAVKMFKELVGLSVK
ncbi:MAG: agmatinase [Candidatus Ranarchaeia archaeon]|jgi:agmatinase